MQQVGVDLYRHGLVTSHGGNVSLREPQGMWITGTGAMLGRLEVRHISFVAHGGEHSGPPPSSDTYLHATTYALSGANAVVHAHRNADADRYRVSQLDRNGDLHRNLDYRANRPADRYTNQHGAAHRSADQHCDFAAVAQCDSNRHPDAKHSTADADFHAVTRYDSNRHPDHRTNRVPVG